MVAMVTLVVLALVAGGCGRKPSVPPSHRLEGVYIVHGFFSHRSYGAPCRPVEAGYPDIRKGTEVTVRDGAGTVARPITAVLAERFPLRRVVLVALTILIAFSVVTGSWKTLALSPSQGGISAGGWRAFIVFGLAEGSIYALIALGYSLVYGILMMINFAHGEVFMSGAIASFF